MDRLNRIEQLWMQAENRIILDIVRRIEKEGRITSTADYQIMRLRDMGKSTQEIYEAIQRATELTGDEMADLYDEAAAEQYARSRDLYEALNLRYIPLEENAELQQLIAAAKSQTMQTLRNLSQSYGFSVLTMGRRRFLPVSEFYQQHVDSAIMDVITGGFDYNTALRRVVSKMTNSGLRLVSYTSDTGRRTYNRAPVAARRAVMTGINQITSEINRRNAAKLGTDHYEVTWHEAARPTHRPWQGRVYSSAELVTVCGLGDVTGLCGANCGHSYYPFVPGISDRMYPDDFLEAANARDAVTEDWHGKQLDAYERTQEQRKMETAMRAQRSKIVALREGIYDKDKLTLERAKYQGQLREYQQFCAQMDMRPQMERVYMDGLGRTALNAKHFQKVEQKYAGGC